MRYGAKFNGIWAAESENAMQQIVTNAILAKGYEGWGSHHYVVNVLLYALGPPSTRMEREAY